MTISDRYNIYIRPYLLFAEKYAVILENFVAKKIIVVAKEYEMKCMKYFQHKILHLRISKTCVLVRANPCELELQLFLKMLISKFFKPKDGKCPLITPFLLTATT